MPKTSLQQLLLGFDQCDKNQDGKLQIDELLNLMKQFSDDEISQEDLDDFLAENDIDKDGTISREEYVKFLNRVFADSDDD